MVDSGIAIEVSKRRAGIALRRKELLRNFIQKWQSEQENKG